MKTAFYQQQLIRLSQLPRDQYQKIYLAGKNGELVCPTCHEKVKLFLGIEMEPHFFHVQSPDKKCPDPDPSKVSEDTPHYIERNGFKIPQGRTLTETNTNLELFQPA